MSDAASEDPGGGEPDCGDAVLVAAVRAGCLTRFGELLTRHEERVRAVIARRLRAAGAATANRDAVAEAVQHTFFLAFRHLAALADPERFAAWLVRIAERVAAEVVRQRSRRRREGEEAVDAARLRQSNPPPAADWIWDEVERLAPPLREALRLRYREGLAYAEIADRLCVPHSTVRGRIHEARRALRRRMEGLL